MIASLPPLIVIPASILMVVSGLLVLAASIGMIRVRSFLPRTHIQAIIYSTSLWCLLLASLLLTFSLKDRTFLHEVLIGLFIFITSPVSTILLVRSYVLREERAYSSTGVAAQGATTSDNDKSESESEAVAASDVASIEAELESSNEPEQHTETKHQSEKDVEGSGRDSAGSKAIPEEGAGFPQKRSPEPVRDRIEPEDDAGKSPAGKTDERS